MKEIKTDKAPGAIGPYSQAIVAGTLVFASGQLGLDPSTGTFAPGGAAEQARQALMNAQAVLKAAGATMEKVAKTTVFLADMADFVAVNEVYAEFFRAPFPARSAVAVRQLPKGALVEVECVAVLSE